MDLNWERNVRLYRDGRLAAINSSSGPALDKMKKSIIASFKNEGLSITIETNPFETYFLDVIFNLVTGKFFPIRKPNNRSLYINTKFNHPTFIRDILNMINKKKIYLAMKKNMKKQNHCMKLHIPEQQQ